MLSSVSQALFLWFIPTVTSWRREASNYSFVSSKNIFRQSGSARKESESHLVDVACISIWHVASLWTHGVSGRMSNAITLRRCSPRERRVKHRDTLCRTRRLIVSGGVRAYWPCVYPSVKFISRKPPTCGDSLPPLPHSRHPRDCPTPLPSLFPPLCS